MLLQGTVVEESHENDEDNLASLPVTWQEIAEQKMNIVAFESVIEEINLMEPDCEEDKLPEQLLEVANTILYISLGIKSVKSHKRDFERLFGQATSLVVVFWQSYVDLGIPGSMWPPPYLREVIDKLVHTVYFIHKLVKRKSQKSVAKRILVGYFGLRDLRKFKKYQRKLGSVASSFENKPNNVNIKGVLLEIIKNRALHPIEEDDSDENENGEPSVETGQPVRERIRTADQEASVKRPRLHKGKAKQVEAEDSSNDEWDKSAKKNTIRRQPKAQPEPKGTRGSNFDKKSESKGKTKKRVGSVCDEEEAYDDDEEYDKEIPSDDPLAPKGQLKKKSVSAPKPKVKSTPVSPQYSTSDFTFNNGVEEGTFRHGSRKNSAAQSKTKKRVSSVHDDDEEYDAETDPEVLERQSKKKRKPISTPKQKVKSAPVSPKYSTPGFTLNNGSGYMSNLNMGNIVNSTIEDSFNDNSVNTSGFNGRRKPA